MRLPDGETLRRKLALVEMRMCSQKCRTLDSRDGANPSLNVSFSVLFGKTFPHCTTWFQSAMENLILSMLFRLFHGINVDISYFDDVIRCVHFQKRLQAFGVCLDEV